MKSPTASAAVAAVVFSLFAYPTLAATTFFNNQTAWEDAFTDEFLAITFEEPEFIPFLNMGVPTISELGFTFTPSAGTPFFNVFIWETGALGSPFDRYVMVANGQEDITIEIDTPVTGFGFDVFVNELGPVTVTAFDANENFLGSTTVPPVISAPTLAFLGIASDTPIASVRFVADAGEIADSGFANIRTAQNLTTPIPAPAALPAGLALIGIFAAKRRHFA